MSQVDIPAGLTIFLPTMRASTRLRPFGVIILTTIVGCASPAQRKPRATTAPVASNKTTVPSDQTIARFDGGSISLDQLQAPLIEGYGLDVLLNLVQLEYAKREVARANQTVAPADIQRERDVTLAKMFQEADKSDYEQLFNQFLQQQHISKVEFNLVLETNAYLRKLAEPLIRDKITDDALQEAFRQLYGETVQVRHIELANLQEVIEAKRRLATGEPFEKVAREISRNATTANLGGEIPPFSRQAAGYPQAFKDAAFALQEGEVSDAVQANGAYHLIKLDRRIPPKVVKFDDVKQSLREDLTDRLTQATMKQLRVELAGEAIKGLSIENPVLRDQYEARLTQRDAQIKDRDQIRQQFEKERQKILERAASQPATAPATTTTPAPGVARPPATTSEAPSTRASDRPATTQAVR